MPDEGFGSNLWKNAQAIKLGRDGGIDAPVRASDRDGVVAGVEHVSEVDGRVRDEAAPSPPPRRGWWARLWRRER